MTQESPDFWAQSAQQFQQTLTASLSKSFQSFQNMDLGAAGAGLAAPAAPTPAINFSPEKLQELQQQYLMDAAGLWSQGVQGTMQPTDKRFAAQAWGDNPVAAFSAASFALIARRRAGAPIR